MTRSLWFYLEPFFTTAEGLQALVFLFLVAVTVVGGLIATNTKRLIRSVAGLAVCFVGVAGLYYYLNSPFVAVMELLIYVGAVCVTIVFAVMLASPETCPLVKHNALVGAGSFGVGLVMFWGLAALGTKTTWMEAAAKVNDGSVGAVGTALLTNFSMVFEVISIVLLIAIIGSLVLARAGRSLTRS